MLKRFLWILMFILMGASVFSQVPPFGATPDKVGFCPCSPNPGVVLPSTKSLPSWLTSQYAPLFDGAGTWASGSSPVFPSGKAPRTLMMWVADMNPAASSHVYGGYGYQVSNQAFVLGGGIGYPAVFYSIYNTYFTHSVSNPVSWHHYAVVNPANSTFGSGTVYIDGIPGGAPRTMTGASSTNLITPATGSFVIGGFVDHTLLITGAIAEVALFDYALDQSTIQKYYTKRLKGNEPGLLHVWHLDDGPSATQFSDSGPNNRPLDIYGGMRWVPRGTSTYGDIRDEKWALSFDGVDDVATGAWTGAASTYPITLEYWAFISSATSGFQTNLGLTNIPAVATSTYQQFSIDTYSTTSATCPYSAQFYTNGTTTVNYALTANSATRTGWHHIAGSYGSDKQLNLYVDGALVASMTTATIDNRMNLMNTIKIGAAYFAGGSWNSNAKGKVCDVRVWDTARTQAQIQANMYTPLVGNEAGLRHYYKCNEGTGTTLNDSCTNGTPSNLTCYNGPLWVGRGLTQDYQTNPKNDLFCLSYDGVSAYSSTNIASTDWGVGNPSGYSIGGWFYESDVNSLDSAYSGLIEGYQSSFYLGMGYRHSNKTLYAATSGASYGLFYTMPASWTGWMHAVEVGQTSSTGTSCLLYLNGSLVASTSALVGSASFSPNGLRIGYLTTYRKGYAADCFAYKRMLSQSEIQSLMTQRPQDYSDPALVGYWPLNEGGKMTTSFDYSTSSLGGQYYQNLTHNGGPTWVKRSIP